MTLLTNMQIKRCMMNTVEKEIAHFKRDVINPNRHWPRDEKCIDLSHLISDCKILKRDIGSKSSNPCKQVHFQRDEDCFTRTTSPTTNDVQSGSTCVWDESSEVRSILESEERIMSQRRCRNNRARNAVDAPKSQCTTNKVEEGKEFNSMNDECAWYRAEVLLLNSMMNDLKKYTKDQEEIIDEMKSEIMCLRLQSGQQPNGVRKCQRKTSENETKRCNTSKSQSKCRRMEKPEIRLPSRGFGTHCKQTQKEKEKCHKREGEKRIKLIQMEEKCHKCFYLTRLLAKFLGKDQDEISQDKPCNNVGIQDLQRQIHQIKCDLGRQKQNANGEQCSVGNAVSISCPFGNQLPGNQSSILMRQIQGEISGLEAEVRSMVCTKAADKTALAQMQEKHKASQAQIARQQAEIQELKCDVSRMTNKPMDVDSDVPSVGMVVEILDDLSKTLRAKKTKKKGSCPPSCSAPCSQKSPGKTLNSQGFDDSKSCKLTQCQQDINTKKTNLQPPAFPYHCPLQTGSRSAPAECHPQPQNPLNPGNPLAGNNPANLCNIPSTALNPFGYKGTESQPWWNYNYPVYQPGLYSATDMIRQTMSKQSYYPKLPTLPYFPSISADMNNSSLHKESGSSKSGSGCVSRNGNGPNGNHSHDNDPQGNDPHGKARHGGRPHSSISHSHSQSRSKYLMPSSG